MNYIKLINAFWQIRRERPDFDPYVIALYFALLNTANSRDWKPFTCYREDLILLAGISASSYYKARKILKDAGLIEIKEGANKLSACAFKIIPVYSGKTVNDTVLSTVHDTVDSTVRDTVHDTILNKPINLKTSKPINKSVGATLPTITSENKIPELFPDLTSEPEKPKEKSSAQKEKVAGKKEHLFRDSPFFDLQKFSYEFRDDEFKEADMRFYHGAVLDWSDGKGEKRINWISVARGFMRRDHADGKLKTKNLPINGQSTNTGRQQQGNGAGADLEAAVAMSRLIVSDGYKQAG